MHAWRLLFLREQTAIKAFQTKKTMEFSNVERCGVLLAIFIGVLFFKDCWVSICPYKVIAKRPDIEYRFTLTSGSHIVMELDSVTLSSVHYLQYSKENEIEYMYLLNEYNNSIYRYKLNDRSIDKILHTNRYESGELQGFVINSPDSIYLYSSYNKEISEIVKDSVTRHYLIRPSPDVNKRPMIYPSPFLTTISPLKKYGDTFVMSGLVAGETWLENESNRPAIICAERKSETTSYLVNYPEMYQKANWEGGLTYRLPFFELHKNSILVSFAANNYLVCYDLKTKKQLNRYAGSKYVKTIRSFPHDKKDITYSRAEAWKWYLRNSSYEGILRDNYRNVYYRFCRLPADHADNIKIYNPKPISIIILDSTLNIVGETKLNQSVSYNSWNSFVSKEGLNIQVIDSIDNHIKFETFVLKQVK